MKCACCGYPILETENAVTTPDGELCHDYCSPEYLEEIIGKEDETS